MTYEDIKRIFETVPTDRLIKRTDIPWELVWEEIKYRRRLGSHVNNEEDWGMFV